MANRKPIVLIAGKQNELASPDIVDPALIAITSANVTDFNEAAQDAVGTILVDTARVDLTYNDGTPSITADLIADSVDNTFLANMAQGTIKGRAAGAGTGDPTDLSAAQVNTILGTTNAITSLTTDVTATGPGAAAATIAANAVTNAKLADVATATFKGRTTAATGDPEDLTVAQAKTLLAITGTDVANTPAGSIAATNVQAALNELDTEKVMVPVSDFDVGPRTTASTTYVTASSTADFTMPYPTTGRLMVLFSAVGSNNFNPAFGVMSFEIRDTNSAGTLRVAATDVGAVLLAAPATGFTVGNSATQPLTGLPTSGTMFIRPMFRTSPFGGNTSSFSNIYIAVIPLV